jgi:hypothetical protein
MRVCSENLEKKRESWTATCITCLHFQNSESGGSQERNHVENECRTIHPHEPHGSRRFCFATYETTGWFSKAESHDIALTSLRRGKAPKTPSNTLPCTEMPERQAPQRTS